MKKFLSIVLVLTMLLCMAPMGVFAQEIQSLAENQAKAPTYSVVIESFMRGAQNDLRSSELLHATVYGYEGNPQELTYRWSNGLGTYLYVYNSHNMYSINNTDGEVEVYNNSVSSSSNMAGRSYKNSFTGKGYAWAAVYGANIGRTSLQGTVTVEVLDANGNVICSDSHTGTGTNNNRKGFVAYSLDADMDNVVLGLFEGDKRNVKDLLGESAILHITCVESFVDNGKIISGSNYIKLTKENGDYYITGTNAGTSTETTGDAQVELDISKGNCKFHNDTSGDAITTVFVFKKPTTSTTTTTLTLTGNLDDRCDYFIGGAEGVKQDDGTIIFTGLTPNTNYAVEVRGEYKDKNGETKYAYAYVYDTTKPLYLATIYTYLDRTLTDIADIHGEDVVLYLLEKDEDAEIEDANFIRLDRSTIGTYTASVENGIYYPWHDDGPEYHQAREYKLVIEHANSELHLHHYSVKYDVNGGAFKDNEDPGTEIYSSATAVKATKNIPVRDGYVFAGWKLGDKIFAPDAIVTSSISSPLTLVAQWEKEVNVTINVTIDHHADGGHNQNDDKDDLVINFLEMKKDSDVYLETGDKLIFTANGVTDGNGNPMAFDYIPTYCSEHTDESVFSKYVATAATYTGLLESSMFGVALSKSGYDVGVIEKIKDENGNWTITIPLTFNPSDFDLEFSVEMAEDVPKELYPEAVIVKIKAWSEEDNQWNIITQQEGNNPGIRVDIDKTTGEGNGSYPVWKYDHDSEIPYGYRAVIYAYVYDNATITVPEKSLNGVTVTYSDGNFTGTMGDVADGAKYGTLLNGAYYDEDTNGQKGTLDAVITVEKYDVTFDAQGGLVNGSDIDVAEDQYYIPDFDRYMPAMEGHNFLGWYLDKECTAPATEGVLLTEDITLYANWDQILVGNVIVDGAYVQDGESIDVTPESRATYVLVELEEITPDGTYNIDGRFLEITWNEETNLGTSENYKFTGLDPAKTYRIDTYIINYDSTYQNSTTAKDSDDNIVNDYNADDYTAIYPEASRWETFVNAFLEFNPEKYFQPVEVDATLIGEGFRPESTLVEYLGKETGSEDEFGTIIQHSVPPYGIVVGMNENGTNDGTYGYEVWKEVFNGNLYEYQAKLTKINDSAVSDWPVIVVYGNTARYSPLHDAPTDTLKVTIIPRWYNVIYDWNTEDNYQETEFSAHIWSYETPVTYVPVRDGYVFEGWYSDEACTDGNEVESIDAAVHADTIVYAKWTARTDLTLKVNYVDKVDNSVLEAQTVENMIFGETVTAESLKKEFTGYSYDSASADSVVIALEGNEITLYYTKNSYNYTVNYLEEGTNKVLAPSKTEAAVIGSVVKSEGNEIAIEDYVFISADVEEITIGTAEEKNVINLYYAADTSGGGENGEESDNIPDKYQKKVIYKIINGTWADATTADKFEYVELKTDGKWDINGTAEINAPTGMKADDGYTGGKWSPEIPETVSGTETETFLYSFLVFATPINPINNVRYIVEHYIATEAGTYPVEPDETEIFYGEIGETVTATAKNYDGYIFNKSVSETSSTLVPIKSADDIVILRLYYDSDNMGGGEEYDRPDGIPDKYQKLVVYRIINGTWEDGTTDLIIQLVELKTNGKWDINGTATVFVPTGMVGHEGYPIGFWDINPSETVSGTDTSIHNYIFTDFEPTVIPGMPAHIVFGKTNGIGWYNVSKDFGMTWDTVFGDATYEVEVGSVIIIRAVGTLKDDFRYYVNGQAYESVDGYIVLTVRGYSLIGALDTVVPVPDIKESKSIIEKIIDFFKMLFERIAAIFKR
ncbi:MAG: InlB B-repeat-containing protein [Clostridia bacterium]|nr:InlB B-repeat-containing protein [Clostridia bacterium]